ncbi:MAG: WD40 repeat domain-containing protein [Kutzneria sp.]|nr:WD40 repeat domain-containing protein [Kutzneria sp.]
MPRSERPLDHSDESLCQFAADLRKLRQQAGNPVYRDLSARSHYSVTALSQAAAGRKLPTLAVTLAYVAACGGDTDTWQTRWRELAAAQESPATADPPDIQPPYLGLSSFQETDADRFFGRDALLAEVLEQIRVRRLVAAFGASGSGKSSLLRAGVAATALRNGVTSGGPQPVLVITPGHHPIDQCAIYLAALTGGSAPRLRTQLTTDPTSLHLYVRQTLVNQPTDVEVILVIDQFEEVFTLCENQTEREAFITALVHAATAPTSQTRVVLGVRADFLGHCAQHVNLREALRGGQVLVGAMGVDELRDAITKPALAAGCTVDSALVVRLVADTGTQPGVLPLVSHALLETWRRRQGFALTVAAYEATGGIQHALTHTAESVYTRLDTAGRVAVRQILLRLIALGEGTEDTKRRVSRSHLEHIAGADLVLAELVTARLVTLDENSVEITHEALINHWPRLSQWLAADRATMLAHRQLADDAAVWDSLHRDPGALYRGTRLAVAGELADEDNVLLTELEQEFLDASFAVQAAELQAGRRRTRNLRLLAVVLAALLVLTTIATVSAVRANREITAQRDSILAAQVATQAVHLYASNPALAAQLALAAYRLSPTPQTRAALITSTSIPLTGQTQNISWVAFSHNGHLLATASFDHTVRLWDITDPSHPRATVTLTGSTDTLLGLAISNDDHVVAAAGADRVIWLWDITDPARPMPLPALSGHTDTVYGLAFSPHSRVLASGSFDHTVRLWNLADPMRPEVLPTLTDHTLNVKQVAFSPDGRMLASGSDDHTARLWNMSDPAHPAAVSVLQGHASFVDTVAFSPDGRMLASGSDDRTARLWNITNPNAPVTLAVLTGHTDVVSAVAFSGDHRTVVTSSFDHTVVMWDISDPTHPVQLSTLAGHTNAVGDVVFSPDGHTLASASADNSVRLWETDPSRAGDRACQTGHPTVTESEWNTYFPGLDYNPPCPR